MSEKKPIVSILMGSRSDLPTMEACFNQLKEFDIPFEAHALSAHRTPMKLSRWQKAQRNAALRLLSLLPVELHT